MWSVYVNAPTRYMLRHRLGVWTLNSLKQSACCAELAVDSHNIFRVRTKAAYLAGVKAGRVYL